MNQADFLAVFDFSGSRDIDSVRQFLEILATSVRNLQSLLIILGVLAEI